MACFRVGQCFSVTMAMFQSGTVLQYHYGHVTERDSVSVSLWPCFRAGQCFSVAMAMFQSGAVFQCRYGHVSELGDMLARARSRKAISRWTTTTVNSTSSASIKTESQPIGFRLHIDCGTADFHFRCWFAVCVYIYIYIYIYATIHLGLFALSWMENYTDSNQWAFLSMFLWKTKMDKKKIYIYI